MSRPFVARFPGVCDACDHPIEPGDTIRYDDAGLTHADRCANPAPPSDVCDDCWMERSLLNGTCECELR